MTTAFIEKQFPVSKVSKESYKERKANNGQALTGLGKWWGRKRLRHPLSVGSSLNLKG
jgi:adenine-specific DNA methylase